MSLPLEAWRVDASVQQHGDLVAVVVAPDQVAIAIPVEIRRPEAPRRAARVELGVAEEQVGGCGRDDAEVGPRHGQRQPASNAGAEPGHRIDVSGSLPGWLPTRASEWGRPASTCRQPSHGRSRLRSCHGAAQAPEPHAGTRGLATRGSVEARRPSTTPTCRSHPAPAGAGARSSSGGPIRRSIVRRIARASDAQRPSA